jgi:hypothetical protein
MTDDPQSPPYPQGPTPLGLQIAHPKQTKLLTKMLFRPKTKPKPRSHRRKKDGDWSNRLAYH